MIAKMQNIPRSMALLGVFMWLTSG
jgi:hypothetical protein